MSYLTVINDKGYQEYIDDVARGLEAEEQRKLALEGNQLQAPQISVGKILLICIALIISTALIFVAVAVSLQVEKEDEKQITISTTENVFQQKQNVWNCNGHYTNFPTDEENCSILNAEDNVDENGTRSITPNAPKN